MNDDPHRDFSDGGYRAGEAPDLNLMLCMSGRALRRLIERVDIPTLSLALCFADKALVERVLRNVSSRTAAHIREEMADLQFADREDGYEAQHFIIETARALHEDGLLSFEGPADDSIPSLEPVTEALLDRFSAPGSGPTHAVDLLVALAARAEEHGLLSLEPALERVPEGVFSAGLRMLVDQLPAEEIESVLGRQIESYLYAYERNGEIAVEGVASIAEGENRERVRARLVAFLPEGEADYERLPEVQLPPSAQAANELIRLCCELATVARQHGLESLEARLSEISQPLLRLGVRWALEGMTLDEIERMLHRRSRTRTERERRKVEAVLEGILLMRDNHTPAFIREALEGFLEEKA